MLTGLAEPAILPLAEKEVVSESCGMLVLTKSPRGELARPSLPALPCSLRCLLARRFELLELSMSMALAPFLNMKS